MTFDLTNLYYIGAGLGASYPTWVLLRGTRPIRMLKDKALLIRERDRALESAEMSKQVSQEMKELVGALSSRVDILEAATTELNSRIDLMRAEISRVTVALRVALRYIKMLLEQNKLMRGIINKNLPQENLPPEPLIPKELHDAIHDVEPNGGA